MESPMRVILNEEESWSFMTLLVSQVLDQVELSGEAETAIKEWRARLEVGSAAMLEFATGMNEALGGKLEEEQASTIRRRDYYRQR